MRVQHPLGKHLPTCTGPDNCAEYAAVLTMTPAQHTDYVNESTARFRTASARTLRTSTTDVDLRRALDVALRKVEPSFGSIVAVDDSTTVIYDAFDAGNYKTWSRSFTIDDTGSVTLTDDKTEVRARTEYVVAAMAPPDAYAAGVAAMRAAAATTESTFEARYKAERLAALNAEYADADKERP